MADVVPVRELPALVSPLVRDGSCWLALPGPADARSAGSCSRAKAIKHAGQSPCGASMGTAPPHFGQIAPSAIDSLLCPPTGNPAPGPEGAHGTLPRQPDAERPILSEANDEKGD